MRLGKSAIVKLNCDSLIRNIEIAVEARTRAKILGNCDDRDELEGNYNHAVNGMSKWLISQSK